MSKTRSSPVCLSKTKYLDVVNVIDDDEFILLYDETFSNNPEFPYDFFKFYFLYLQQ